MFMLNKLFESESESILLLVGNIYRCGSCLPLF